MHCPCFSKSFSIYNLAYPRQDPHDLCVDPPAARHSSSTTTLWQSFAQFTASIPAIPQPQRHNLPLMAPVAAQDLTQCGAGTGKTFSIVFAVIAFLIVAICIVWGYFIPKWRFKYGRPSSTRFNCIGGAAKFGPSTPPRARRNVPHFPYHPGLRDLHNISSLSIYNPRTESPFGNGPRNIEFVHLHGFTPTFAAATQRKFSSTRRRPTHDYELPKTPDTLSQLALTHSFPDLGLGENDDSEPDRSMGGPVARPAGRAPPLTKQLALSRTLVSNPAKCFDTLALPNLLFEKLDKLDSPKVSPETDESCLSGLTSVPKIKRNDKGRMDTTIHTAEEVKSEVAEIGEGGGFGRWSEKPSSTKHIFQRAIAVPKPIHRRKSKMPVGNIRDRYDWDSGGLQFIPPTNVLLQRRLTPSTEPLTSSACADSGFSPLNTPPTSHCLPIHHPTLIPTPLRVRRAAARAAAASLTPADTNQKHSFSSGRLMALSPSKLAPFSLQKSIKTKRKIRTSTGFNNPTPSLGTTAAKSKPIRIKRSSWKSSSAYSRDTKGVSILPSSKHAPDMDHESDKNLPLHEPSLGRANSMDLVRSKIDDWNLHTGDLELPIPPLFDTKSKVDPRSSRLFVETENPVPGSTQPKEDVPTSFSLTLPIPKIYVGRSSDDVFSDGKSVQNSDRVLGTVLDVEMVHGESDGSGYYGRTAPGGVEWI